MKQKMCKIFSYDTLVWPSSALLVADESVSAHESVGNLTAVNEQQIEIHNLTQ